MDMSSRAKNIQARNIPINQVLVIREQGTTAIREKGTVLTPYNLA